MTTINGAIITDFGSLDTGNYVFTQADGKITVMGITSGLTSDDLAVARYNADGSLDTSFDSDGKLIATAVMTINAVRPLSDGKFITVGGSAGDFAVARYNSDGSLDSTFDMDGKATTDFYYSDYANAIAVQADGKLLVVGSTWDPYYFGAARYNADGSLDTGFSTDGEVYNDSFSGYGAATAVAIQPDGKSVIAGISGTDFGVARLDRYGNMDTSFDGDGKVSTDLGGTDIVKTVMVLSSGKILMAGTSNGDFALVRYNANGSLDTSFDTDGKLVTDLGGTETLNSLITLADGKFLAAGTDGNNDLLLMRFNSDGSLDSSFDSDGKVATDLGGWETGNSVAVQSDGKILLAGTTDTDIALVRYNSDGSLDTTFNGAGGVTATNHLPTGKVTINDTTPTVGDTLVASHTLADADGLGTITYQWLTGSTVLGTGTTHTVTAAELGKTLTVSASYTDKGGSAETVSSAVTAAVAESGTVTPPVGGTPGFVFTPQSGTATGEDGTSVDYAVTLNSQPVRDVTLTFTSSNVKEGAITSAKTMTFTNSNWATAQTLTIKGVDDAVNDGNVSYQISVAVSTIDINYKLLTVVPLALSNTDNDAAVPGKVIYGDVGGSKSDFIASGPADDQSGDGNDTIYGLNMPDDLSGGLGNDTIYGGLGPDNLFGEDGNDTLWGDEDADYMEGGAGNDTLDGGTGSDTMIGGKGNDTYYLGYDAKDVINDQGAASDVDTVIMPYLITSYTLPKGIENGTIAAGTSNSNLTGNTGNNELTGNAGNNILNGAVGRDSLFGGVGNDVLVGGTSNDTLSGGAGKDVFKFDAALTANTDKITDFVVVDDTIQLENAVFKKFTATGVLNAGSFVKGAAAHDSNDYIIYNATTGAVSYDADGSGAGSAVQIAVLGANLSLTNADFMVI
ncbi:MAG: hypothetical protein EPN17_01665 [Methylobacter sp.]|nr:MAG: hypothetical protein EPN17_01665 [Methylobacter sp.]